MAAQSREMWAGLLAPTVPQLTEEAVEWQVRRGEVAPTVALQLREKSFSEKPLNIIMRAPRFPTFCPPLPQPIGSMLIARSREESEALARRREMLGRAGVEGARLLTAAEARQLEPALELAAEGSALLVPSDVQAS